MLKLSKLTVVILQKLALMAIFLLLGLLAANQYALYKNFGFLDNQTNLQGMVTRASDLNTSIVKLRTQLNENNEKLADLKNTSINSGQASKLLADQINSYQIIAGVTEVTGQGVELKINHKMATTQLVDLVNALRNCDAEAISINDARIVVSSEMNSFENDPEFEIKVIGNKDILYDSLIRPGGILDSITTGEALKVDNLILPKAK